MSPSKYLSCLFHYGFAKEFVSRSDNVLSVYLFTCLLQFRLCHFFARKQTTWCLTNTMSKSQFVTLACRLHWPHHIPLILAKHTSATRGFFLPVERLEFLLPCPSAMSVLPPDPSMAYSCSIVRVQLKGHLLWEVFPDAQLKVATLYHSILLGVSAQFRLIFSHMFFVSPTRM